MITTDALKYLPHMGLDPSRVVGCAGAQCQNSFTLANGFAVEAIVGEKFSIAFFCSAGCYLNEIRRSPRTVAVTCLRARKLRRTKWEMHR